MPRYDYAVAADGSGDFRTVQEAIDAATGSRWRRFLHRVFRAQIRLQPGFHMTGLEVPVCCGGWLTVRLHISGADSRTTTVFR